MTHDEAFVQAIREEPHDDGLRLIYADWLEDQPEVSRQARAEFIRLQIQRHQLPARDLSFLQQREQELLETYWERWTQPLRDALGVLALTGGRFTNSDWLVRRYRPENANCFRRGLIETALFDTHDLLTCAEALFRVAPIRELRLGMAGARLAALAKLSLLRHVEVLEFIDFHSEPVGVRGLDALATSPFLERLRILNLDRNNLGDRGVEVLARAPWLKGVRYLGLGHNGVSVDGVLALAEAQVPMSLAALNLSGNRPGEGLERLLCSPHVHSLVRLDLSRCDLDAQTLRPLLEATGLPKLRQLDLSFNSLWNDGTRVLGQSPLLGQLERLDLRGCGVHESNVQILAQSPYLGKHRELYLLNHFGYTPSQLSRLSGSADKLLVVHGN